MQKSLFLLLFFLIGATAFAQGKNSFNNNTGGFTERQGLSIELGGASGFAQDVRFSRLQYAGLGVAFGIGSVKQTADRERRLGLDFNYTAMKANLNQVSTLNRLQVTLAYDQQRPVGQLFGAQWLVGGEARAAGTIYTSGASGNNSTRVFTDVSLTAMSSLRFKMKDNLLTVGAGIGLLHWAQDNHSFAFSYPQHVLEAGEFSYEDSSPGEPFGSRQLQSLFDVGQFRTHIDYRVGKRLGFSYDWEMTRYTQTEDYPVTQGEHRLMVSYTF
jgi:hypothetical protein